MTLEDLRKRKKELRLTNKELADLSGIPVSTVAKILGGTTAKPRRDTLRAIEQVLFGDSEAGLLDSVKLEDPLCTQTAGRGSFGSLLLHDSGAEQYGRPGEMPAVLASPQYVYGSNAEMNSENTVVTADSAPDRQAHIPGPPHRLYTLEDYLKLPDERRVELIDGRFYDMAAPSLEHQIIAINIWNSLNACIRTHNKRCIAMIAPYDVLLDSDPYTVVQPDIMILCDDSYQRYKQRAPEAPLFVCEVLSPSTALKDRYLKLFKYLHAGVKEVWLVDREHGQIEVYCRVNNSQNSSTDAGESASADPLPASEEMPDRDCLPTVYTFRDTVPVAISDGKCSVDFAAIDDYLKQFDA